MRDILEPYVGQQIGTNAQKPYHLDPFTLAAVTDSYFTVTQEEDATLVHIPYKNIVRILQNETEKIHVGSLFKKKQDFKLIVKIGHVVTQVPA
ncbi:MAG: hypothetical protein ACI87E_004693 [Mariniblastus sp.]|jgi:hypothetical protein